jgi:hypothetical protein
MQDHLVWVPPASDHVMLRRYLRGGGSSKETVPDLPCHLAPHFWISLPLYIHSQTNLSLLVGCCKDPSLSRSLQHYQGKQSYASGNLQQHPRYASPSCALAPSLALTNDCQNVQCLPSTAVDIDTIYYSVEMYQFCLN